ncbi:unnamed protein product [Rotaria sp. Silwood2]|nr:unnamed protein product [Rotaria sp. Silwood2]CAF3038111.1 unnamed protein product [Rotaria sp. Silwood2]CAF3869586.1 unnamed protein product [Rotaria sp. Silwood2]
MTNQYLILYFKLLFAFQISFSLDLKQYLSQSSNTIKIFFVKYLDKRKNKTSSQFVTVSCYECTNCTDPFTSTNSISVLSSCNSCYKLAINIAYAPYSYVVRKCVPACIETSQTFGGGSVLSTCCTTNLCNASSMITFPSISRIVLFILIILNVIKSVY